jgi:hypothetical protein
MVEIRASQYEQMKKHDRMASATWQSAQFLHPIPPCIRGDMGHFPGRSSHVRSRSTILPDLAGPVTPLDVEAGWESIPESFRARAVLPKS